MLTLKEFERKLESKDKFISNNSNSAYPSQELKKRLQIAINELEKGEKTRKETIKYFPRGKIREAYKEVLKTEWFDIVSERFDYKFDNENNPNKKNFYLEHKPSKKSATLPYQGYKIRVSARPEEAREVAKAVLKPLRKMSEFHKVVPNAEKLQGMQGSPQEGKFISIYPEISEKEVLKNGKQRFTKNSHSDLNEASINANYRSTETVIKNIEKALKQSSASLNGGSTPPTDIQYKNTRISYRYGIIGSTRGIFLSGETPWFETSDDDIISRLTDVEGKMVKDNRRPKNTEYNKNSNMKYNWKVLKGRKELR